jgi:hypothetical protein
VGYGYAPSFRASFSLNQSAPPKPKGGEDSASGLIEGELQFAGGVAFLIVAWASFRVADPLASFNRQAGRLRSQATLSRIGSPESRIGGDPVLCRKTERGPYHDDC